MYQICCKLHIAEEKREKVSLNLKNKRLKNQQYFKQELIKNTELELTTPRARAACCTD